MSVLIKPGIGAVRNPDGTYQSIDGFSPDITQLKNRVETLENAPAVDVPVKSVSAKGTTFAPDVNGNVDIPSASADTWGLVMTAASYGTTVNSSNGKLSIYSAINSEIDTKSSKYKPIVPATIDRVIRAGLISNSQITDADKALICQTIGAFPGGKWNTENITLSENSAIRINLDHDVETLIGRIIIPSGLSTDEQTGYIQITGSNVDGSTSYHNLYWHGANTGGKCRFGLVSGMTYATPFTTGDFGAMHTNLYASSTIVTVRTISSTDVFPKGTQIILYWR